MLIKYSHFNVKIYLISFLLLIVYGSHDLFAHSPGDWFVDASLSISLPTGDFGDDDIYNEDAGGANPGLSGAIKARTAISEYFGFFGMYQPSLNALSDDYQDDNLDYFSDIAPSLNWSLSTTPWISHSLIIGPYVAMVAEQLEITFQAGFGAVIVSSPELELTADDGIDELTVTQESGLSVGFGLYAGGDIRYWFSDTIGAYIGVNYIQTEADFDDVELTMDLNGNEIDSDEADYSLTMSIVSVPVGISFRY